MPDLYLTIADQDDAVIDAIAASMDTRAGEPEMQAICASYMAGLPRGGRVLEVGCGNGATTALILDNLAPAEHVGVDPSPGLIAKAETRYAGRAGVSFALGDASDTGQPGDSFDVVIVHTVFSHLADPRAALAEAMRVLKPGGVLAVFDGDYATNTVALHENDALQAAMVAVQRNLIHDPYIMRKLPGMARAAGFEGGALAAHGYVQTARPDYIVSLMRRGVDAAVKAGDLGGDLADGFIREAAQRVADGSFYGAILFVSMAARKPE